MGFLLPKPPAPPELPDPISPTNEAVRRRAELARRSRLRSGRSSTLLTRGGSRLPGGAGAASVSGASGGGFAALAPGGSPGGRTRADRNLLAF